LLLFQLRQSFQSQELSLGTPEATDGLEVKGYPEDQYAFIHFASPSMSHRAYDSLPERIILEYFQGKCWFGFGQEYTMAMITKVPRTATPPWHMIQTFHAIRQPDISVIYGTLTNG
jgi:hypothetical protein